MTLPSHPLSPRIDNPAAVVIGGANIDQKWRTRASIVMGSSNPATVRVSTGGVGRNVAENLARMRVTTALIAAVGEDENGERIRREAEAAGVDTRYMVVTPQATGVYTAVLNDNGEMIVAVSEMDATAAITAELVTDRRALIANCRYLILDCNVPKRGLVRAAELAAENSTPVIVDPVSAPKADAISTILAAGLPLHTITPNLDELARLTGVTDSSREGLCRSAEQLHAQNVGIVWVSLGARGSFASVADPVGQRVEMIPALPATLVDATGGGDAMLAGYVAGLLRGLDAFAAVRLGRAAAAITIETADTVSTGMSLELLLARGTDSAGAGLG